MDHQAAKAFILAELRVGLPIDRTYHSFEHTLDVNASTITNAEEEGVGVESLELLKTAALYHDSGFLVEPESHEHGGCVVAQENLPGYGYNAHQIKEICAMIMATKIPQKPMGRLSEILCDADLDYLGRRDFFFVGDLLFNEMKAHGTLSTRREWNLLQEEFISKHSYFTKTSRALREPTKQEHLEWVRQWLRDNP
jgi:hypothetical protein